MLQCPTRNPLRHSLTPTWDTFTWVHVREYNDRPTRMFSRIVPPRRHPLFPSCPCVYRLPEVPHAEAAATHTAHVLKRETRTSGRWIEIGASNIDSDGNTALTTSLSIGCRLAKTLPVRLLRLETAICPELECTAVFCNRPHDVVGCAGWNLSLNFESHADV